MSCHSPSHCGNRKNVSCGSEIHIALLTLVTFKRRVFWKKTNKEVETILGQSKGNKYSAHYFGTCSKNQRSRDCSSSFYKLNEANTNILLVLKTKTFGFQSSWLVHPIELGWKLSFSPYLSSLLNHVLPINNTLKSTSPANCTQKSANKTFGRLCGGGGGHLGLMQKKQL